MAAEPPDSDPARPRVDAVESGDPSAGLRDALVAAGVTIVDGPGSGGPVQGLQLWTFQLESMEREIDAGGGYLGAQLDGVTSTLGELPYSYLLAGWMAAAGTPAAQAAAAMMGDQPWEQAPSLVYPTGVLALFTADAVRAAAEAANEATRYRFLAAEAPRGICEKLAGWVSDVLDWIFEGLKVSTEGDWARRWLGPIWNTAVDLARGVVEGTITAISAPVIAAVKSALVVVAVVVMIGPILKPWSLDIQPSRPSTRFAVGDEPDIMESFVVSVDTNIDVGWPDEVVSCANVADLELPDPTSARGSKVIWLASGLLGEGRVTSKDDVIGEDDSATLRWVTGREESDEGDLFPGRFAVHVTVLSKHTEQLDRMITGLINGAIPDAGILEDVVGKVIASMTEPVREKLRELMSVSGVAGVDVTFHLPASGGSAEVGEAESGKPASGGFRIVQQAFNVGVSSEADSSVDDGEVSWTSFDGDTSRQSTLTVDNGDPQPIDPLGLAGPGIIVLPSSASSAFASAQADALLDIQMNEDPDIGAVWLAGDYATTMVGDASACDTEPPGPGLDAECPGAVAQTTARAAFAIVFTISGDMDVNLSWSCELDVDLMEVVGNERGEIFIDRREPCDGEFTGRLRGGRTYQFLANLGLFDWRSAVVEAGREVVPGAYATPRLIVWDRSDIVAEGVASYSQEQKGAFVMELVSPE